jgi:TolA-binding protein
LKPRAFVVMPFGKKRPIEIATNAQYYESKAAAMEIDFDAVFKKLLEPALSRAGFDPVRADSQAAAGDIRTDMFFELVTADLVVADISIANPNVFYELGVRHGVCPRGVFVVQGDFGSPRPFDVAPDRTFRYDGSLFAQSEPDGQNDAAGIGETVDPEHRQKQVNQQVEHLSQTFKHAQAGERETIGSPVYQHLPGLEPVNWDKIETSKASYFGALRDDWLDCVRAAQSKGHPGDILTLAEDAPTLVHRTKILYEAARALIDLCRYGAAERALGEVIQQDPNHFDAQLQLGRVYAHQGRTGEAEHHLRNIMRKHEDDPNAADLLGQVSRYLWHLSWRDEPKKTRKQKAMDTSQLAALAVRSFVRAQQADARAYFAGFNALILIVLLEDLRKSTGRDPAEILPTNLEELVKELTTVVKFCAKYSKERATESGDYVEQFWTTTTLSGIALIENDDNKAIQRIREACSIPGATFFQLSTFQERLLLCDELDFRPKFVKPALELVQRALTQKNRHCTCKRVFLWSGYPVDKEGQRTSHFPKSSIEAVAKQIHQALEEWKVGEGDLAICEGIHEGDILFAEACRSRKARVRMMLLQPANGQSHAPLWPFSTPEWEQRFHDLRLSLGENVWFHADHLGPALDETSSRGLRSLQGRHKSWLFNTAQMEAEPALDPRSKSASEPGGRLFGLFLWNGEGDSENPENPLYFIRRVNEFNGYEGQARTIRALT